MSQTLTRTTTEHQNSGKTGDIPVTVTAEPACPGRISPMQYGQFVEYLCDLIPAMWAEKLFDGSFEGSLPYDFHFMGARDMKDHLWYPDGQVNRADFINDESNPVTGKFAKKIVVGPGSPATVGISQDGIFVERGKPCTFSCYIRQEGLAGPVRVRLHTEGKNYASAEFRPGHAWEKFSAKLIPTGTDTNATLTIEFRGPGTVWLDNASLIPDDNIRGWRPDVVAAVKAMKPAIIRFGGSVLEGIPKRGDFEWTDMVGPVEKRKPFYAWGGLQPVGPGLEEIAQFCQLVDAELMLCVRVTGRTAADAAAQVEYFNGSVETPMGARRARNGHPAPYNLKYWQVGNELAGEWYDQALLSFSEAMLKVDPSIKISASYPSEGGLKAAGRAMDYVSPHHYERHFPQFPEVDGKASCKDDLAKIEQDIIKVRDLCRTLVPGRKIRIAVTEWNTTAGHAGLKRAHLWSLSNALMCSRYHNLIHRYADVVEIAMRSNLINSFCSGSIQTDNHRLYKTPTYYAQQLYSTLAGDRPLKLAETEFGPLDLSATLSPDGKTFTLFVINMANSPTAASIDLSAIANGPGALTVWTLADSQNAGEPEVTNTFGDPQRIAPAKSILPAAGAMLRYAFQPYSLTVLQRRL